MLSLKSYTKTMCFISVLQNAPFVGSLNSSFGSFGNDKCHNMIDDKNNAFTQGWSCLK